MSALTGGTLTETPLGAGAGPSGMALGSNGKMWFTDDNNRAIGEMTSPTPIEIDLPTASVTVAPKSGPVSTAFTVTWAAAPATAPFVKFEARVRSTLGGESGYSPVAHITVVK